MRKRIYLSSPTMNGREIEYVNQAFESNWVAPLGPNVDGFEREICEYTGAPYAVATSAGTAAIHMALRYLGVSAGDYVFCQSLTFSASANPIVYQGATPVFIDSEEDTWNMSPDALRLAFKKYKPKAVVVVHLYGTPAKMDEILDICREYDTPVIEDAAESLGATYRGKQTGIFGDFGIYSFNGNKIITTSGGGMLVCRLEQERKTILKWITQSREVARHYEHKELGYNYRMSNICAGIGRGQLLTLDERISQKTAIYKFYEKEFSHVDYISMNPLNKDGVSNHWLSCITLDKNCAVSPDDIMDALDELNIESRPIWKPMHLQAFYADCPFVSVDEKDVSKDIFERGICLPSDVKMTDEDMSLIVETIKSL